MKKIKCLLCGKELSNLRNLITHYTEVHNIDIDSVIFKRYLLSKIYKRKTG